MFANVTDDTNFPFSHSDEDLMEKDDGLKCNVDFESMDATDLKMLLKSSFSYNESFLENWYLYILVRFNILDRLNLLCIIKITILMSIHEERYAKISISSLAQ